MIEPGGLDRRYLLGKEKFFYVLRDINLHIADGEFISVMGPSHWPQVTCWRYAQPGPTQWSCSVTIPDHDS
jgi:ABC-type phosphate/phosphonate transport system ATPase subunit